MSQQFPRWLIWGLLALTLFIRGRALQILGDNLHRDPDAYREIADCVAEHHVFGFTHHANRPFFTAYRPPLYPLLLSCFAPFYHEVTVKIGSLHLLMGLVAVWLVWRLGRDWQLSTFSILFAVAAVAVDPLLLQQSAQVMTETFATLLATAALAALGGMKNQASRGRALVSGLMLGLCVLCRPTFLIWLACIVFYLAIESFWKRSLLSRPAVLFVSACVIILPWALRNQHVFGHLVATTTHGGYTLLRANNPLYYEHLRTTDWGTAWSTARFDSEWRQELQASYPNTEIERDRIAYRRAEANIRNEPGMFVYSSCLRIMKLWGIVPWQTDPNETVRMKWLRYSIGVFYFVEFALAVLGAASLGKKLLRPPWVWGTLLVLSFTAVHAFYWTDMRMRAPLVPVVALVAAVGAGRLWERFVKPQRVDVAQVTAMPA